MKDSTTGYCSCYAGLFGCTTKSEESKKLRGTTDILVINLFVHPTPDPTWSFDITADCLQDLPQPSASHHTTQLFPSVMHWAAVSPNVYEK